MAAPFTTTTKPLIPIEILEKWPAPQGVEPTVWARMSIDDRRDLIIERSYAVSDNDDEPVWTLRDKADDVETLERVRRLQDTMKGTGLLVGALTGTAMNQGLAVEEAVPADSEKPTADDEQDDEDKDAVNDYKTSVVLVAIVVAILIVIAVVTLFATDILGRDDGADSGGGQGPTPVEEEMSESEADSGESQDPAAVEEAGESDVVTDVGAQPVTSLPEHPSEMQGTWEQTTLVGDQDELWTIQLGEDNGVGTMVQSQEGMDDLVRYWRMGGEEGEPLMLVSNTLEKYDNLQHDWAAAVEVIGDTMTWAIGSEGDNVLTFERS